MDIVPLPFNIVDIVAFFGLFSIIILFSTTPKKEITKFINKLKDIIK